MTVEKRIAMLLEEWAERRQLQVGDVERGLALPVGWVEDLRSGRLQLDLAKLQEWLSVLDVSAAEFLGSVAGLTPEESLLGDADALEPSGLSRRELDEVLRRVDQTLHDLVDLLGARAEAAGSEVAAPVGPGEDVL